LFYAKEEKVLGATVAEEEIADAVSIEVLKVDIESSAFDPIGQYGVFVIGEFSCSIVQVNTEATHPVKAGAIGVAGHDVCISIAINVKKSHSKASVFIGGQMRAGDI